MRFIESSNKIISLKNESVTRRARKRIDFPRGKYRAFQLKVEHEFQNLFYYEFLFCKRTEKCLEVEIATSKHPPTTPRTLFFFSRLTSAYVPRSGYVYQKKHSVIFFIFPPYCSPFWLDYHTGAQLQFLFFPCKTDFFM